MPLAYSARYISVASALVVSLAMTGYAVLQAEPKQWVFDTPAIEAGSTKPRFETLAEFMPETGIAHAPSITSDEDGFSVLWFQGSKEAKPDVEIVYSRFEPRTGSGYQAGPVMPLLQTDALTAASQPAQEVIVLGNTIGKTDPQTGFYATVLSVGGWAMSGVMDISTRDGQVTSARRLDLSPILARSNLVRAPALEYADGDTALPTYFELGNAFAQLARIGSDGRVSDLRRISNKRYAIQPDFVVLSESDAVALMRGFDGGKRTFASWTEDGGRNWSEPEALELPSPDAPVAALALSDGRLLVAYNNDPDLANRLDLAVSDNQGHSWQHLATLENLGEQKESKLRYPALSRLNSGEIVLSYSFASKQGIRVQLFNEAWLNAQ